ncbi:TetR/AcrR family transcriptional regulator [Macrococcoides goetzii]|uniref:TetR/AcrR family transcriptional regulator n=1 Tax=Macrococcus sp. PK TaxID=2801919 RepID=UPI001F117C24|nr:TetR/AcrR family transcriptional regulator [Macrococcus sp. PK]MCH4984501.1 TetR/AcrR family transcriptional regulator [Macrococcus sp. PK]
MNENDLRVRRTKKMLIDALGNLLKKHTFTSISVNMICDTAMVHRTTFYKHFYDKYDLLSHWVHQIAGEYEKIPFERRVKSPFQSLSLVFLKKFEEIDRKQEEDQQFRETVINDFVKLFKEDLEKNIDKIEYEQSIPESLVFFMFSSSILSIIAWAKHESIDLQPEELDALFLKINQIKLKDLKS